MTTDIDLIHRCAAHGWALRPDGDGYELIGNGPVAFFRDAENVEVWLSKQRVKVQPLKAQPLKAPFPAFGGKSAIAPLVWDRFGIVDNLVEPFVNSAAIALAAPYIPAHETWNDLNGFVSNFWRATQHDPDVVADAADWPINECDLHARHAWLMRRQDDLTDRLMGDPDYYDAKIAGWWLWGICQWIGSGWCSGEGPWTVNDEGRLINANNQVVWRQRPHLGNAGMGINRKLPHLGDAGMGITRQRPHLSRPKGINATDAGQCAEWTDHLRATIGALRDRIRRVRVCCGDWSRVCGPTPTVKLGLTACFMDPPYFLDDRDDVYDQHDSGTVARDVQQWCIANGSNPKMRIALCGYEGHYDMPNEWTKVRWKAAGGYGSQGNGRGRSNAKKEVIWFSPHCLGSNQLTLGF